MKLKDLITQYVAFRKSMGGDFESAANLLNTFCRRMGVDIDIADIGTERVEEFLAATGVNRYWRRKYDTLRGFYRYATSRGFVNKAPLPATVPKMPERFVPYIYNADELQRLINPTAPERIGLRKLQYLEETRTCSLTTRNQRLSVIHALAHFIGQRAPEHIEWCGQIQSVPFKRTAKTSITYLEKPEMDALLAAPDRSSEQGRRDYTLLLFLYNTGARADEAAQLSAGDLRLTRSSRRDDSSVQIRGKGNKQRLCPLWPHTARELDALVVEKAPTEHVFMNRCGRPLTRFGIHAIVKRYAQRVSATMPALAAKSVSPHSIRHTCATHLLRAGVDINTIRAWLGHVSMDTTNVYAETDLEMKTKALAHCEVKGSSKPNKRWRHDPGLMAFLKSL